ncbi:MAG: HAD family hydrolase, partial [Mollicutes bacterium]|nr:HAD family hydrolase [Mollicutes bacterium]
KYFTKVYTGSKNGPNKSFNFTKVMKDFSGSSKDIIYIGDSKKDVLECQKSNIKILSINFDNERLAKIKEINNFSYSSFIELELELNKYL